MKYISEIMEKRQSELFKNKKVFFSFSNDQFKKGLLEHKIAKDIKMVSMGAGMYCPKSNAKDVAESLHTIYKESIIEDMKQGKQKVILRELYNHECFYTGDITDCVEKLSDYPITEEEIKNVYFKNYENEV